MPAVSSVQSSHIVGIKWKMGGLVRRMRRAIGSHANGLLWGLWGQMELAGIFRGV